MIKDTHLFTLLRGFDKQCSKDSSLLYLKVSLLITETEAYYFSKDLISDFYKQRFPLSQHPNFSVINYPTKAYIGNQVAKMALVCESIDEDVMTLRGM